MTFSHAEEKAHAMGYRAVNGVILNPRGKRMAVRPSRMGYPYFHAGRKLTVRAHRLVAFQKFGQALYVPGTDVRHRDANPGNFADDNILIGTKSENQMDKPVEVRRFAALKASKSIQKYDHAIVLAYLAHHSYRQAQKQFPGISVGNLSFIKNSSLAAKQAA
jgi:hypothetical protein